MDDQTPSGSRPEPAAEDRAADETWAEAVPIGPTETSSDTNTGTDARRAQLRGRAAMAGAATALALGGGLAGFVIGHGTAGDDRGFTPANFSQQGPANQRQFGDGQPPPGFNGNGGGIPNGGGPGSTNQGSSNPGNPT